MAGLQTSTGTSHGGVFGVANAAAFPASEETQYITGTELVADGGLAQKSS